MSLPAPYYALAREVAAIHGLTLADVGPGDNRPSVNKVRVAVWRAVRELGASFPECAEVTGHRNHTTVLYALYGRKPRKERAV